MSSTMNLNASHPTEARPYAKGLFEYAKENQALEQCEKMLVLANKVIEKPEIQTLLTNPTVMADQKAEFMLDLFKVLQEGMQIQEENFIRLLAQNDRFALLPSIYVLYSLYLADFNRTVSVKVVTALPVEPEQQTRLLSVLEKKLQRKVAITYEEDKTLLGGALLCIGDEVIDSSVKGRLTQLKSVLLED